MRDETGGGGDERHFYYNDRWQVLTETVEASGSETVDAIYSYHPHYVDAVAVRMRASDHHFYTHDANFNVTATVDDSTNTVKERYAYTPYGEVTYLNSSFITQNSSLINNEYLYTGRRLDPETGLQLNRNRFYASHLGRWVNRDPIGYKEGDFNLYGYVLGRPTYYVDPSGLDRRVCFFGHCWIEVEDPDNPGDWTQLHFDPWFGYSTGQEVPYPSWPIQTIPSTPEQDQDLLDFWDIMEDQRSRSCNGGVPYNPFSTPQNWNPVNNCWLQSGLNCRVGLPSFPDCKRECMKSCRGGRTGVSEMRRCSRKCDKACAPVRSGQPPNRPFPTSPNS